MKAQDLITQKPQRRIIKNKHWAILVLIAVIFGAYGSNRLMESGKLSTWHIAATYDLISHEKESLADVEKQIEEAKAKGEIVPEDLLRRREKHQKRIDVFEKELERLKQKYESIRKQSRKEGAIQLFLSSFLRSAYASEERRNAVKEDENSIEVGAGTTVKRRVLYIALAILAVVYVMVNYKVWFSSNPRNMELATDLMKTITGFWIGLGTSVF